MCSGTLCKRLYLLLLAITTVHCQLGFGGMYGSPYGYGLGAPGMGLGMGLGMDMFNNPYGYASYYYRCRNLLGGGMYNPMMGPMMGPMIGKRK